ncbi:MAG: YqaE/Pmp3 family membrane protein [Flavobacteriales bacterium]
MRKPFLFILPLLLSACSLMKAPHSGDFSRVKYNPHLAHEGRTEGSGENGAIEDPERIKGGPSAFREREIEPLGIEKAVSESENPGEDAKGSTPSREKAVPNKTPSEEGASQGKKASGPSPLPDRMRPHPRDGSQDLEPSYTKEGEVSYVKEFSQEDESDILLVILCFLLPPLPVFMVLGSGEKFLISVILTLLFWAPGIIYSIYVVGKEKGWF